ncbi:MAG: hypothetical protein WCD35_05970 [Mycobacteriales bacterium]
MYPWLWRHLPGPLLARFAQSLLLLAGILALLFLVVFPAVESALPYSDVTVPSDGSSTSAPSTTPSTSPK